MSSGNCAEEGELTSGLMDKTVPWILDWDRTTKMGRYRSSGDNNRIGDT